ncbi:MAG: alkaline phosphatase family protein [Xanthomonadales bacterium]|nr:alkaline phosphatase family protein [Xanthomonadales bacterium]
MKKRFHINRLDHQLYISKSVLLLVLFILSIGLSACGEKSDNSPADSRLIIVGFDGMDPNLTQQWMDAGVLPNFSKLAAQGTFHPLATSNPPQSPVAWSSFATGLPPGEHGIYDFLRRDADTYSPDFSISKTIPPENILNIFGLNIPLDEGQIINRRQGVPFWSDVESEGGRSSVIRVPVTYPPDPIHRMMAGMGVPDLLGTQGTYTLYTTRSLAAAGTSSSRVVRMRPHRSGRIETSLEGPTDPLHEEHQTLSTPMILEPTAEGAKIQLGGETIELAVGEWSPWIRVEFDVLGPISVTGIVRLNLVAAYPRPQLYVSPINIDPEAPVVPISSPADYAADLAGKIGLFHTIGMPEETWSLNENHISDKTWLEMLKTNLDEREAMFFDAMTKNDSEVLVGVFVQTDRVSHMFYRGIDPEHPLYPETDELARGAIEWIYKEADRILGKVMAEMGPDDRLIVLSDHGFAPFRWAVNLNRWLVDNGYLVLKAGKTQSGIAFSNVDWSKSTAYALGLNGLYINRKGREAHGIVEEPEANVIKARLIKELPRWTFTPPQATQAVAVEDTITTEAELEAEVEQEVTPAPGQAVIRQIFDGDVIYAGNANGDAPDLVVGYEPAFRASWQTTLGAVPKDLIEPNAKKWSGDHCITPEAVPGILFTNFKPEQPISQIAQVAAYARKHWKQNQAKTP